MRIRVDRAAWIPVAAAITAVFTVLAVISFVVVEFVLRPIPPSSVQLYQVVGGSALVLAALAVFTLERVEPVSSTARFYTGVATGFAGYIWLRYGLFPLLQPVYTLSVESGNAFALAAYTETTFVAATVYFAAFMLPVFYAEIRSS